VHFTYKNSIRTLLGIFVFWAYCSNAFGQTPAHFYIGQNEFSNTHVYSLHHHSDHILYAATNYGLHKYQNGRFQQIPWIDNHDGEALFSLRKDTKGNLYCSNLSGEIFKLTEKGLKLFLKVPDEYITAYFDFGFDDQNRVIVCSRSYVLFDNGKWKELYKTKRSTPASMNAYNPKQILFPSMESSAIFSWENGIVKTISGKSNQTIPQKDVFRFPSKFNSSFASISTNGNIFNYKGNGALESNEINWRVVQVDQNELWLNSNTAGIIRCVEKEGNLHFSPKMFRDEFISTVTKGENGTLFLGTFGKGVIVAPSVSTLVYTSTNNGLQGIFALEGDQHATISKMNIPDNVKTYTSENATIISSKDPLFFLKGVDFGLNNEYPGILYTTRDQLRSHSLLGTIKDVQRIDETTAVVGTSFGLFVVGDQMNGSIWDSKGYGEGWNKYKSPHFRCNAVGYCKSTKEIYFSKKGVLHRITPEGDEEVCFNNDKEVRCSDIFSHEKYVVVATTDQGILYLKNGKVEQQISSAHGLGNNAVRKITIKNDKLYIAHRSGFQIYNAKDKSWTTFGNKLGINSSAVTNIVVQKENLWLICHGDLVRIPLNNIHSQPDFQFNIGTILLGGQSIAENSYSTSYDRATLKIPLDFKGIEYEKDTWIEYRLNKGDWKNVAATSEYIEYTDLRSGKYSLDIRINYQGTVSNERTIEFTIHPPFWQTLWFVLIIILIVLTLFYLYYQRRIRKIKISQQEKIKNQQLITEKLESELKALRSQMNPHFIFNALNSIQDLILREETDNSYDYIVLFSRLVRNTLNYSGLDFIPIHKEMEFLEVYLSLEKLRFEDDFNYTIENVNAEGIELPSLLIQPFVENALVHGLMHKKGPKSLSIRFELNKELKCIVEDNGVGRERAKSIQTRQQGDHKSFAMKAIKERLELLNKQSGETESKYEIIDKYENEEPTGTRIEITIPHRRLY
jgi:hypothetical protein